MRDIGFIVIKMLDIGLVAIYFFVVGIVVARLFDYALSKLQPNNYKDIPLFQLFLEIILQLFALGIIAYIVRNIIKLIPFPLDGVAGFNHRELKELEGGEVMSLVLIVFSKNLQDKILYFIEKML